MEDSPRGFPYVASYLDSDDTFAIFRRFGWVHARLLLNKQDELRALESELRAMDKLDGDNASSKKYLQSRTKDNARQLPPGRMSRQQLLETLEKKTMEYGALNPVDTDCSTCILSDIRSTTLASATAFVVESTGRP